MSPLSNTSLESLAESDVSSLGCHPLSECQGSAPCSLQPSSDQPHLQLESCSLQQGPEKPRIKQARRPLLHSLLQQPGPPQLLPQHIHQQLAGRTLPGSAVPGPPMSGLAAPGPPLSGHALVDPRLYDNTQEIMDN